MAQNDVHTLLEPTVPLRDPSLVMRMSRIGAFHQTRLSFMRQLLRRLKRDKWQFDRPVWRIDNQGVGIAVYTAKGPDRTYSLVAFAHDLDPAKRSDRVIAEEWDSTFTLFNGIPTEDDLTRLADNVPKQEAGRISGKELSLSRANRSVRLFTYVKGCLAKGKQPEASELDAVGYLMRTTAVYGSGKFGALDREFIADRDECASPFQIELLSVYLTRAFTLDMVEYMAQVDAPDTAVPLAPALKRRLGVGNSTGLGMAPFLVNHPTLINNWILARETALARVRSQTSTDQATAELFLSYVQRQKLGAEDWRTSHEGQTKRIEIFRQDIEKLSSHLDGFNLVKQGKPWDQLYQWGEANLSLEGQEALVSLLIEPFGDLVDDLGQTMSQNDAAIFPVSGAMPLTELMSLIEDKYKFALDTNFDADDQNARFWYASEEKLEPRVGERFDEEGAEREHPLAIARDVHRLFSTCAAFDKTALVAELLLRHPEHRHVVRRVQRANNFPYGEVQDNLIAYDMMPIDLLRCKLSFFGAVKFDPRSDRWVRITLFQHAPLPNELSDCAADDWAFPPLSVSP